MPKIHNILEGSQNDIRVGQILYLLYKIAHTYL